MLDTADLGLAEPARAFLVGGAVRDALLGRPTQDRDFVVVGATPEAMLAAGFLPVGRDFPVFLHPKSKEEYALARSERKTQAGYHGFVFHTTPDISLEQDLARRDLTINAIALPVGGQEALFSDGWRALLVDPFGGQADLAAGVFRHVSPAFAEDPVRILRLARFAARFERFTVAAETQALMQEMVRSGEVDALVPERVWQELARGLLEVAPRRMFEVLARCGALARLVPELDAALAAAMACIEKLPPTLRAAGLGLPQARLKALRAPSEVMELSQAALTPLPALTAEALLGFCHALDVFRKPERFDAALEIVQARQGPAISPVYAHAACAARGVAIAPLAAEFSGAALGAAIRRARLEAIRALQD